jgi:hypothetical protein
MTFINPIEILELQSYSISEIDSSLIKKAKRKLFAEIDLSDNGLFDYKGISLTKTDCETAIDNLENPEYIEFYSYLANSNQSLNYFLTNGDERFFAKFSQESIYSLPEFVDFISPYFALRFDKALHNAFITYFEDDITYFEDDIKSSYTEDILETQILIKPTDINIAFKSLSVALTSRINETRKIAQEIKDETSDYDDDNIDEVTDLITESFPIDFLNLLPKYFQSQIHKTAATINQLQLAIWNKFDNPSVCRKLLEHLLALHVESVNKKTFENNYKIVRKVDESRIHINNLHNVLDAFEGKAETIDNARNLICQAKQYLFNIKAISQDNHNTYISLSTRVASVVQNFIIEEVNKSQSFNSKFESIYGFSTLKITLKNAWEVTQMIGSLEMQNDFIVNRYNPNRDTLKDICGKLNVATPQLFLEKIPQCNFAIIDGTITHTDKNSKSLPITDPFIRGDVRYIGLNLKIEAFENQSVKFDLKYIQPNGIVETGRSSPEGFTLSADRNIGIKTKNISFPGWGNSDTSTYIMGTHYIEVWIENCMIYRKSFIVDLSPEEKIENARIDAEEKAKKRKQERIKNMCYFCEREMAISSSRYETTLYKETARYDTWNGRRVEYRYTAISIPRCKKCEEIHSSSKIWFWVPFIAFALTGLLLGSNIWGYWFGCFLGGGAIGLVIGFILSFIVETRKAKKANIKKEKDITSFPPVRELLNQGWTFSQPTA